MSRQSAPETNGLEVENKEGKRDVVSVSGDGICYMVD